MSDYRPAPLTADEADALAFFAKNRGKRSAGVSDIPESLLGPAARLRQMGVIVYLGFFKGWQLTGFGEARYKDHFGRPLPRVEATR